MYEYMLCDGPLHKDEQFELKDTIFHCIECGRYQVCEACYKKLTWNNHSCLLGID